MALKALPMFESVPMSDTRRKRIPSSLYPDSMGKLVHHLAALSPDPVYFGKRQKLVVEPPKKLVITPSVFREFRCIAGCHSCCAVAITLDYLPMEFEQLPQERKDRTDWKMRTIQVNGVEREIMSVNQAPYPFCPYLTADRGNGAKGCSLWPMQPLECASAPQVSVRYMRSGITRLSKVPFGRAWRFPNRAQCEFHAEDEAKTREALKSDIRLLGRYQKWAAHLGIMTLLPALVGQLGSYAYMGREFPKTSKTIWSRY